jgi:hypothetical protein
LFRAISEAPNKIGTMPSGTSPASMRFMTSVSELMRLDPAAPVLLFIYVKCNLFTKCVHTVYYETIYYTLLLRPNISQIIE